ncbi:MAG: class I SAM-dependent methyltransferase [Pseudohongiellaceae bacterium]
MIVVFQDSANVVEESLAARLGVQLVSIADLPRDGSTLYLQYLPQGLCLCTTGLKSAGPTIVDFFDAALNKRVSDSIRSQNLIKALGLKKNPHPMVLDCMAGLGKDAYLMASAGCIVTMWEKSDVVHELLSDGLERFRDASSGEYGRSLSLQHGDFLESSYTKGEFDIVYLDPMYPLTSRKSRAKKDMDRLHDLLGFEKVDDALFQKAVAIAGRRVVVKRPKNASNFASRDPDISYQGSSARFDVYLTN